MLTVSQIELFVHKHPAVFGDQALGVIQQAKNIARNGYIRPPETRRLLAPFAGAADDLFAVAYSVPEYVRLMAPDKVQYRDSPT